MKIGVIGAGNMATAIVKGLCGSVVSPADIFVSDKSEAQLEKMRALGVQTGTNEAAASFGDTIILAVKPNVYAKVLPGISAFCGGKLVISIAAGISISFVKSYLTDARIVRLMPNTPALVGAGMTAICYEAPATEEDAKTVSTVFSSVGKCIITEERLMDAVCAVSGSGPAYAYLLIESMASAGVCEGLTKKDALLLAAQTVYGAAKMVLETGMHPAVLCDNVCSPGGTTIDAVRALEKGGFRAAVFDAVDVCAEKSRNL